jgi:hypothetical protein
MNGPLITTSKRTRIVEPCREHILLQDCVFSKVFYLVCTSHLYLYSCWTYLNNTKRKKNPRPECDPLRDLINKRNSLSLCDVTRCIKV